MPGLGSSARTLAGSARQSGEVPLRALPRAYSCPTSEVPRLRHASGQLVGTVQDLAAEGVDVHGLRWVVTIDAQEAVAALAKAEAFPNAPGVLQGAVPLLAGLHALQDRGLAVRRGRPRCRRQQVRSPFRARPTLSPLGVSVSGEERVENRGRGRGRFGGGVSGADPGARWV